MKIYMNCGKCLKELPIGRSPSDYSRLEVGLNDDNQFEVRCIRHDCLVAVLDEGLRQSAIGNGCAQCGSGEEHSHGPDMAGP